MTNLPPTSESTELGRARRRVKMWRERAISAEAERDRLRAAANEVVGYGRAYRKRGDEARPELLYALEQLEAALAAQEEEPDA